MILFFVGLLILVGGYFTYGKVVEKYLIKPDDTPTPAIANPDGVDFMVLPHWKNIMIQLLNIAGLGPVVGLILGIKFGAWVFLILPIGNVLGGALHDYLSGMMSVRHNGANLPTMMNKYMGPSFRWLSCVFVIFLLTLVVTVFIDVPGKLIIEAPAKFNMSWLQLDSTYLWPVFAVIFVYYILATLFPIDQIIGRIYPLFGALLILATAAMFGSLCWNMISNPELLTPSADFLKYIDANDETSPMIPVLFVTIACGIISGFHATQSPMIARTIKHEKQGRQVFYGTMIMEGIIGMVWGAMGMAIYNIDSAKLVQNATDVMISSCSYFLGDYFGIIAIISVVILSITTGDTAARCLRLNFAEMLKFKQSSIRNRLILAFPIFVVIASLLLWANKEVGVGASYEVRDGKVFVTAIQKTSPLLTLKDSAVVLPGDCIVAVTKDNKKIALDQTVKNPAKLIAGREITPITLTVARGEGPQAVIRDVTVTLNAGSFTELWRYCAWVNQALASLTFMMCAVWLFSMGRCGWASLVPGTFMTFIVTSFLMWNKTIGFSMDLWHSYYIGIAVALIFMIFTILRGRKMYARYYHLTQK